MASIEIYIQREASLTGVIEMPKDDLVQLHLPRPLSFLRFAIFSIVGVRGHFYFHGPRPRQKVDYGDATLTESVYIYEPDVPIPTNQYPYIDTHGLNDRQTTRSSTNAPDSTLRSQLVLRDGFCLLTRYSEDVCDGAHILPHSKGSEYIQKVTTTRRGAYSDQPVVNSIDCLENALLLKTDLHRQFGKGAFGLVTLPNFAMDTGDIPYLEDGLDRSQRTTVVRFKPPLFGSTLPELADPLRTGRDVVYQGTDPTLPRPSTIVLDFHFGMAFYKHYPHAESAEILEGYHLETFKNLPPPPSTHESPPDDEAMLRAGDALLMLSMHAQGLTPKVVAEMERKQLEEDNKKIREKVNEWRGTVSPKIPGSPNPPGYHPSTSSPSL